MPGHDVEYLIDPKDPIPDFDPPPRAILVKPIYYTPPASERAPMSPLNSNRYSLPQGNHYTAPSGSGRHKHSNSDSYLHLDEGASKRQSLYSRPPNDYAAFPPSQFSAVAPRPQSNARESHNNRPPPANSMTRAANIAQDDRGEDRSRSLGTLIGSVEEYLKLLPPSRDFCWSECTGRKKAVCIGINYIGQKDELHGCINDARNMRDYLMNYQGFRKGDILLLTDDWQERRAIEPSRQNMLDAMHWLIRGAKKHDSLFFHYSGHGGQIPDETGKEADGLDEVIFPLDYKQTKEIIDDELFKTLVQPLPSGCRLTAVIDSCHSGTVLDLPYMHSAHGRLRGLNHITKRAMGRPVPPADVICFAACKDDETSADTFHGNVAVGAMSWALIKTLKEKPKQTYDDILAHLRKVLIPKYHQKAQLSTTHPVDLERDFII